MAEGPWSLGTGCWPESGARSTQGSVPGSGLHPANKEGGGTGEGRLHCATRGTPSPGPAEGPTPDTMRGGAGADVRTGALAHPAPLPAFPSPGGREGAPGRPARLPSQAGTRQRPRKEPPAAPTTAAP